MKINNKLVNTYYFNHAGSQFFILLIILKMYHYFAYGSNMSARRIRHRLGWAPSRIATVLPDYQLTFDKQSSDGGKANIRFSYGNIVEGVLYFVREQDMLVLDRISVSNIDFCCVCRTTDTGTLQCRPFL